VTKTLYELMTNEISKIETDDMGVFDLNVIKESFSSNHFTKEHAHQNWIRTILTFDMSDTEMKHP